MVLKLSNKTIPLESYSADFSLGEHIITHKSLICIWATFNQTCQWDMEVSTVFYLKTASSTKQTKLIEKSPLLDSKEFHNHLKHYLTKHKCIRGCVLKDKPTTSTTWPLCKTVDYKFVHQPRTAKVDSLCHSGFKILLCNLS